MRRSLHVPLCQWAMATGDDRANASGLNGSTCGMKWLHRDSESYDLRV